MRQRLFVARELFKRPNLLLLDEAASALDTESERYIQQRIDALKGQMTVVIIAHRLSTIQRSIPTTEFVWGSVSATSTQVKQMWYLPAGSFVTQSFLISPPRSRL